MKGSSIARYLQINRSIAVVRDGEARWALPGRRAGRFAAFATRNGSVPSDDEDRAAALERSGLPRRYARAILF